MAEGQGPQFLTPTGTPTRSMSRASSRASSRGSRRTPAATSNTGRSQGTPAGSPNRGASRGSRRTPAATSNTGRSQGTPAGSPNRGASRGSPRTPVGTQIIGISLTPAGTPKGGKSRGSSRASSRNKGSRKSKAESRSGSRIGKPKTPDESKQLEEMRYQFDRIGVTNIPTHDIQVDISIIGNFRVGKTSMAWCYVCEGEYELSKRSGSLPLINYRNYMDICGQRILIKTRVPGGTERSKLGPHMSFFADVPVCFLLYDITSPKSFKSLERWRDEYIYNSYLDRDDVVMVVVGTKDDKDNKRRVTQEMVDALRNEWASVGYNRFGWIETSCKNFHNIDMLFKCAAVVATGMVNNQTKKLYPQMTEIFRDKLDNTRRPGLMVASRPDLTSLPERIASRPIRKTLLERDTFCTIL